MQKYLIMGVLFFTIVGACAYYYKTTQAKIEQLIQNNVQLEENVRTLGRVNEQNVAVIERLEQSYEKIQEDYNKASAQMQDIRKQNELLAEKFEENRLAQLAQVKPKPIERIVNNATKKAFRCLEILSGSPLTDNERKSQDGQSFNSECPWLFDPVPR